MKNCIFKKSNYLMCEDYIADIEGECVYKTDNNECVVNEYMICNKCKRQMIFRDNKWHCMCGNQVDC